MERLYLPSWALHGPAIMHVRGRPDDWGDARTGEARSDCRPIISLSEDQHGRKIFGSCLLGVAEFMNEVTFQAATSGY